MQPGDESLISSFQARKPIALARLITRLDDGADPERLLAPLRAEVGVQPTLPLVGITGAPGSGKSTLAAALVAHWRKRGETVAILAIDPQSPFSGGALLGDRVRMKGADSDHGVFFRSLSSRGALGGTSRSARAIVELLRLWGFDHLLVETVGAGQGELAVRQLADVVVLVLNPGTGDGIQWEKAGQIEIADVYALNKADRDGIDALESGLREAISIAHESQGRDPHHTAPIVRTVATNGIGVEALEEAIADGVRNRPATGSRFVAELEEALSAAVRELLQGGEVKRLERSVAAGEVTGREAIRQVLNRHNLLPRES